MTRQLPRQCQCICWVETCCAHDFSDTDDCQTVLIIDEWSEGRWFEDCPNASCLWSQVCGFLRGNKLPDWEISDTCCILVSVLFLLLCQAGVFTLPRAWMLCQTGVFTLPSAWMLWLCVMVFAFGFVLWMLAFFLWCRCWFWFDIVGVISVLWREWHLWFVLWMSPLVLCCECHLWLHGVGVAFVRMMWMSRLVLWWGHQLWFVVWMLPSVFRLTCIYLIIYEH